MDEWLIWLFPYACSYAYALVFVLASWFLIPSGVKSYQIWKKNEKALYLGGSVACFVSALFLFIALFLIFLKPVIRFL
ncbi:MAG: hypothetical protein V4487_02615 [Chlamydiota bacterium]